MFELKTISKEAVATALEKAKRYRLLNEPRAAESICLDVLAVDPENQKASVILLLSITDQFGQDVSKTGNRAREVLPRLKSEYERSYYGGIVCERQGRAILESGVPGCTYRAYEWLRKAMEMFETAEAIRPPGNDDAILRWNACARTIMQHNLEPRAEDYAQPPLE